MVLDETARNPKSGFEEFELQPQLTLMSDWNDYFTSWQNEGLSSDTLSVFVLGDDDGDEEDTNGEEGFEDMDDDFEDDFDDEDDFEDEDDGYEDEDDDFDYEEDVDYDDFDE
jgi:hypothetical protein